MKKGKKRTIAIAVACAVLAFGLAFVAWRFARPGFYYISNVDVTDSWPNIEEESLTENQQKIIASAKRVWEEPRPESFYTDVPQNEAWCANFVSYVYREAGLSFTNPVAGGWRIPGIYTLTDYLTNEGYWHPVDSGYEPVVGDIVIYDRGVLSGHTNIVLAVNGNKMTTIGGNENKAIHIRTINRKNSKYGIQGYGHIE